MAIDNWFQYRVAQRSLTALRQQLGQEQDAGIPAQVSKPIVDRIATIERECADYLAGHSRL